MEFFPEALVPWVKCKLDGETGAAESMAVADEFRA